jgi:threonine synthase
MTPCRRAGGLEAALGHRPIWIKDETVHPTRTTKDRMASVVLAWLDELAVRAFATSSTGNSSTALAHGAARLPQFTLHLVCGEDFLSAMNWPDLPNVRLDVLVGGTFVEAFEEARRAGARRGLAAEGGFFNPARRAGLKLAFLEAVEQMDEPPAWYVQAVSSGMGVLGVWRGALELREAGLLDRLPRLCCVQQESCAPMALAFAEGSAAILPRHVVARPSGPARAILRGDPTAAYPYVRTAVLASRGRFEVAPVAEILRARTLLREVEGVDGCEAAACTVVAAAGMIRAGAVAPGEPVLLHLTGGPRPAAHPPPHRRLVRRGGEWVPEEPGAGGGPPGPPAR